MIRTAVIGLGDIARVHLPILQGMKNVTLVAVCDENKTRSDLVPNAHFYESARELLEKERPDAVHICLPHYLHFPIAQLATQYNAHVFCEKPLALNAAEAKSFENLEVNHQNLQLCLCLQNRYNATTKAMLQLVESGDDGKLLGIRAVVPWQRTIEYYKAAPWRGKMELAGGGVMINQSIHTLDIMQLLGGKIKSISGNISSILAMPIEVEDTATAQICFENGVNGLFFATNANSHNASVEMELTFEKATYVLNNNRLYLKNESEFVLLSEDERMAGTKFYYGASHAKAIDAFYKSIETGSGEYIHAKEGVISMQMIDAIAKSSETKKAILF